MCCSYLCTGEDQVDLAVRSTDEGLELLTYTGQETETVVVGQCLEEVLDRVALVGSTSVLLKLGDNLRLVASTQ